MSPATPSTGRRPLDATKKRPKRKARRKPDTSLVDNLSRPFPPNPKDVTAAGDGKTFRDKLGRPYAIRDEEAAVKTLAGLGAIMATTKECAAVLGVSEPTIFAFFRKVPAARMAWESGKENGKASLRRSQFSLAQKNATMAIFLGLNYLEQKDRREIAGAPDAPIKHEVQHSGAVKSEVDYDALPLDELVRLHGALTAGHNDDGSSKS